MTTLHETGVEDLFNASLQKIAQLGPATDEGFQAAVEFGQELVNQQRQINFTLGDVAVLLAPGSLDDWRTTESLAGQDSKRLAGWSEAVGLYHPHVLNMRRTAIAFPAAWREAGVSYSVYQALAAVEVVEGVAPAMWVKRFITTNDGRTPKPSDVDAALGRSEARAVKVAEKASVAAKVEIAKRLIDSSPEVAEAAEVAIAARTARVEADRQRRLDGEGSSTALSVSHEVLEIEQALVRIIPILARALDNTALIAGATQAEHIALLAKQAGGMATHLGEVVAMTPADLM